MNPLPKGAKILKRRYWLGFTGLLFLGFGAWISLRLALTQASGAPPQGILVLGGNPNRMYWAADLAHKYSDLPVWISDGAANREINLEVFQKQGIARERITHPLCATDTVTDFTCAVESIANRGVSHIYLVTSDYHMARAQAIAYWVLGSRGIWVTPVAVDCLCAIEESALHILRDQLRAILWLTTGRTGASLNPRLRSLD
ncbi:MAG: YdcF family protein [Cyanobacteriota bacterium]|nr:YdcF family protein [Cyanobacteriota bacterium]